MNIGLKWSSYFIHVACGAGEIVSFNVFSRETGEERGLSCEAGWDR
jgi:hypothetical protein